MKKELISIIIPVYNVQDYVRNCVSSILNQSYKNIEIILVDDGATDKSGKICDKLQKQDDRIKVYHKKNGGLSDARNYGMKYAKGKYIMFIDSDDYINKYMVEDLYTNLINNSADISMCDYKMTKKTDCDINKKSNNEFEVFNKEEAYDFLLSPQGVKMTVAWNKLYKKELFNEVKYPVGKYNEDEAIIHLLINQIDKIVYSKNKYYYYLQRKGSIMSEFSLKKIDGLEFMENRGEFFKQNGMEKYYSLNNYYCCYKATNLYNSIKQKEYKKIKMDLKKKKNYYAKLVLKSKYNPIRSKLVSLIYLVFPQFLTIMSKINFLKNVGE